ADDTLCLFDGTARQLNLMKNYLNSINPKLKFTLENDVNDSINFLDISIGKKDGFHTFSIYRKPTATDQTIHASSNHPMNHKLAAFNSLVHQLL
ncbi:hypothetical protein, partial [Pseudomonas poae]|uniref:hypothetical protein n=1 Tax=Pseudomonas poae TaxID=200451 RepID=UPI0034D61F42